MLRRQTCALRDALEIFRRAINIEQADIVKQRARDCANARGKGGSGGPSFLKLFGRKPGIGCLARFLRDAHAVARRDNLKQVWQSQGLPVRAAGAIPVVEIDDGVAQIPARIL